MNVTWTMFAKAGGVIPNSRIKYTQYVFVKSHERRSQVSIMKIPSLKNADPKFQERGSQVSRMRRICIVIILSMEHYMTKKNPNVARIIYRNHREFVKFDGRKFHSTTPVKRGCRYAIVYFTQGIHRKPVSSWAPSCGECIDLTSD